MHEWTPDQLDRKARAEAGDCVVVNVRKDSDVALRNWAKEAGRFVYIGRRTCWGNAYRMADENDRAPAVDAYRERWPHQTKLHARLPELRGKVLGCWCHPRACHGHIIADAVNAGAANFGQGDADPR